MDGHTHRFIIPYADFAGSGTESCRRLLSRGIPIPPDPKVRRLLREYIFFTEPENGTRALAVAKSGWHGEFTSPEQAEARGSLRLAGI
ncbi:DUF927 domain-containing protein [Geobacter grbiciae]|nr:DUF927 domain-containing protein [Geobacter grbiciae]